MTQVRPAGSILTLEESMKQVEVVQGREGLIVYLQKYYKFLEPTEDNIRCKFHGYDERCDWNTYLVTVGDDAVLFTDGLI